MAHTFSIGGVSTGNTVSVSVPRIDTTQLESLSTEKSVVDGRIITNYVLTSTNPHRPLRVVVSSTVNPKKPGDGRRVALAINASAEEYDEDSNLVATAPIIASCSLVLPLTMEFDTTDVAALLQNAFGLMFESATAGVIDTDRINKLAQFGATAVL